MSICLMLDVDGVLVTGRPADGHIWTHKLYDDLGLDPDLLVQEFFEREWLQVVTGKRDLYPTLALCLKNIGTNLTAKELISYWFEMDSRLNKSVLADCRAMRNKGHQIYLTTNQEHLRAQYLMDALGLGAEVDGIIYSAQAGFQKPSPEFYHYAADIVAWEPKDMLLVDDTQANIDGAINAGWCAVHWKGEERLFDILRRFTG
ncbi:MAG: HAD-IA family hydrolase [Litoreibacter sp.]